MKTQNKYVYYWVIQRYDSYDKSWDIVDWYDKRYYSYKDVKHDFKEYIISNTGEYRITNRREINPDYVKIFNNPQYSDRYTAIFFGKKNYLQMIGFNDFPYHPMGFGQHCGEWKGGDDFSELGKQIALDDLSNDAQKFVIKNM